MKNITNGTTWIVMEIHIKYFRILNFLLTFLLLDVCTEIYHDEHVQ